MGVLPHGQFEAARRGHLRPGADRNDERSAGRASSARISSRRVAESGWPIPRPIFILGLPRSGSTLLEQILASHSQVEGTSELPYLGRVAGWLNRNRADGINYPEAVRELEPRAFPRRSARTTCATHRCTAARARRGSSTRCRTTFRNVGLLSLILPNAKIIDARRHPLDACLSCYRQLFAKGQNFTYDLTEIGEYYLQYQR